MSNRVAKIIIAILTIIVLGLIYSMYTGWNIREWFDSYYPDFNKKVLPYINALLNSLVSIFLLLAYRAIRRNKITQHKTLIYTACFLSFLFLVNYVFYHIIADSTKYGGEGAMRIVYFIILLTHIMLAGVSFPFILYTIFLGHTMQVELHKKMTRWVFPIWFYVAISGVLVYLMISPFYS